MTERWTEAPAVRAGDFIYVSGQVPKDENGNMFSGTIEEETRWTLEELARYSGVVLENVLASQVGSAGMEMLSAWVESTGSGLMITGGRKSYGPGGYFGSPLDRILPVSMEMRKEHRKLQLAIVVALDRSGSMSAPAGGGKKKIDLANIGTVQVLDLLGPTDELGVIAVDSRAHTMVDLAPVDAVRGQNTADLVALQRQEWLAVMAYCLR